MAAWSTTGVIVRAGMSKVWQVQIQPHSCLVMQAVVVLA
jgi:hypothetical protein